MKKKILLIISLLVALCMSFTLIACGPRDGGKVAYTAEKAQTEIGKFTSAKTLKGELTLSATADGVDAFEDYQPKTLEKRGNQVLLSSPMTFQGQTVEQGYLIDLDTGYMFSYASAGGVSMAAPMEQLFSQGFFDYAEKSLFPTGMPTDTTIDISDFTYNSNTNEIKATYDIAQAVNALFKPFQTVYSENGNGIDLVEGYLRMFFGDNAPTFAELVTIIEEGVSEYQDMTVEEMIPYIDGILGSVQEGLTWESLLISFGVDPEDFESVQDRTLGEMLQGLFDFLGDMGLLPSDDSDDDEGSEGSVMDMVTEIAMAAAQSMFFAPVDTTHLEETLSASLDMVSELLEATDIKELIDRLPPKAASVKAIIADGVKFERLGCEIVIGFDDKLLIDKVSVEFACKHDFDGTTTDMLLQNNEYIAGMYFDVDSYSASATSFDFEFIAGADAAQLPTPDFAAAIACGEEEGDFTVLYEVGGKSVSVSSIQPYVLVPDSENPGAYIRTAVAYTGTPVTYNAQTKTFTFARAYVDAAADAGAAYIGADFTALSGSTPTDACVELVYCETYDSDTVVDLVTNFIMGLADNLPMAA